MKAAHTPGRWEASGGACRSQTASYRLHPEADTYEKSSHPRNLEKLKPGATRNQRVSRLDTSQEWREMLDWKQSSGWEDLQSPTPIGPWNTSSQVKSLFQEGFFSGEQTFGGSTKMIRSLFSDSTADKLSRHSISSGFCAAHWNSDEKGSTDN